MSLLTKRQKIYLAIFHLCLVICFVITAFLLVGYASGYRVNWKIKKVQLIGEVYLESLPRDADVFIDNNLQKNKTPCRIALLPGTYKIRVEKKGFYEWHGTAEVKPKLVTEFKNIILFLKEKPSVLAKEKISNFLVNNNQVIFWTGQKIFILSDNDQKTEIFPKQKNETFDQYLNLQPLNKNKLFLTAFSNKKVVNFLIEQNTKSSQQFNFNLIPSKVALNPRETREVFLLANRSLYKYKFGPPDKKTVLNHEISDFEIMDGKIYYIKQNILWSQNLEGRKNTYLVNLPINDTYKIIPWKNYLLILGSKKNLLMFEENKLRLIDINVTDLNSTEEKLLYTNGSEIWTFDPTKQEKTLITRLSEKISNLHWLNKQYILFVTDKKLRVIEMTGKNDTTLVNFKSLNKLVVNKEKKIYYLDKGKFYSLDIMPRKSLLDLF